MKSLKIIQIKYHKDDQMFSKSVNKQRILTKKTMNKMRISIEMEMIKAVMKQKF